MENQILDPQYVAQHNRIMKACKAFEEDTNTQEALQDLLALVQESNIEDIICDAYYALASFYLHSSEGRPQDPDRAEFYAKKLAESGDPFYAEELYAAVARVRFFNVVDEEYVLQEGSPWDQYILHDMAVHLLACVRANGINALMEVTDNAKNLLEGNPSLKMNWGLIYLAYKRLEVHTDIDDPYIKETAGPAATQLLRDVLAILRQENALQVENGVIVSATGRRTTIYKSLNDILNIPWARKHYQDQLAIAREAHSVGEDMELLAQIDDLFYVPPVVPEEPKRKKGLFGLFG